MGGEVCPRCDADIPEGVDQCPECKKNLTAKGPDIENPEKVEETLDMVDDETYEIKSGDSDTLIENIKKIGSSRSSKEGDTDVREQSNLEKREERIVYQCPVCGAKVEEDDIECPDCGAAFEE